MLVTVLCWGTHCSLFLLSTIYTESEKVIPQTIQKPNGFPCLLKMLLYKSIAQCVFKSLVLNINPFWLMWQCKFKLLLVTSYPDLNFLVTKEVAMALIPFCSYLYTPQPQWECLGSCNAGRSHLYTDSTSLKVQLLDVAMPEPQRRACWLSLNPWSRKKKLAGCAKRAEEEQMVCVGLFRA